MNNCGEDVEIVGMNISFTNNAGQNALLDELGYNIFRVLSSDRTFNLSPDLPSPVSLTFDSTFGGPLSLLSGNDNTNPVRIRHKYTGAILNKIGATWVGETIRSGFFFQLASQSGIGRCDVEVVTNPLSIVTCDPAGDPLCGQ